MTHYSFGAGVLSRGNLLSFSQFVPIGETNTAVSQVSGFDYLVKHGNDLDVVVPVLAGDSRVKILQRLRIQTSNGVTATVFVGESRPSPTSTYYSGGAYSGCSSTQQLQVGVTIEVTPSVKPDGFVLMDIHQKIDRLAGSTNIPSVGEVPFTSSTEAQAKVVVRDHETILLGGLIETDITRTPSGVPPLKEIPLLGALFRSSSARTAWSEIIVLIRPTILSSSEAAAVPPKAKKNEQAETRL